MEKLTATQKKDIVAIGRANIIELLLTCEDTNLLDLILGLLIYDQEGGLENAR